MNEEIPIYVRLEGREEEWKILVEGDGPWILHLESSNGVEISKAADNVFSALQEMRATLAQRDITLCCNGARVDVRPSPQSASYGAWMVYVLHMWRPPTVRDLVPTFGYCADRIGSVEEQDAYWERHLARRKSWVNFVNPLWWIYLFTASWGKPKKGRVP
ncbi:hypothetical protein OG533_31660 [Streptomyces sp. NBC_01186]|uniref:hypothetical protein n=1 Tax=Streptomyces sp. NBC_01186 TaxID=2903765 RepID=UPI002E1166BA|nr:hypothetical protein OG533_31660 [Streptomyces sp. NBC_01186]